ncbi:S-adenosylmethionine-dependent methyltransferase [Neocucurbitaria cava]|uniref:tRNA(Phe) (4-demethylwyosine(37)-C(7)) aminocarboxypropyltransferase n=1 Tax=Neocucurbitaria cava TaxID=798079 RepID=A0A9W8Y500_9PLEO|nr:S-adenosylmethionine-dependent methyltransferase [Neocucurbitaria cava]
MVLEQNSMNDQQKQNSDQGRVILEVPQSHVKSVKSALEQSGQLDRTTKITFAASKAPISTTKGTPGHTTGDRRDETVSESSGGNVATPIPAPSSGDREPSNPFPVLKFDLASGHHKSPVPQSIWKRMAEAVGATHVAVNSPIPLQTSAEPAVNRQLSAQENILRSPVNLTPIYGDFGPSPTRQTLSSPTEDDFEKALWATTIQNGIHQTWAPRYTMFSRGNITEKTRLLNLPSVTMDFDVPSATADLYAGIGYFAFSYRKSGAHKKNGIKKVLCWELNPWSVEGLRRGAELNGWTCKIWRKEQIPESEAEWEAWRKELLLEEQEGGNEDFWIFQTSNEHAASFIQHLRHTLPDDDDATPLIIPPIRRVNLGLLPKSTLSWRTAVRVLDFSRGGWIHAHENVSVADIGNRTKEIEAEFQQLWDDCEEERYGEKEDVGKSGGRRRRVKVEHVERVKMYAPGVVHCVFDVYVEEA